MPEPRPFFLVPQIPVFRTEPTSGRRSGRLRVTITVQTPLHFGAGQLGYDDNKDVFVNRLNRENEQISLPGSSFKGMLRSVFEALSESCMVTDKDARCNNAQKICPACTVFGLFGRKGKLGFSSFPLLSGETEILSLPQLYSHPTKQNQRRFYRHSTAYGAICAAAEGRRGSERYECLAPGAVLQGHVIYQNLDEDQLGGLLFALGLGWSDGIYHKLGYAKPVYLGSVKLDVEQGEIAQSLLSPDDEHPSLEVLAADYRDKHKNKNGSVVALLESEWSKIGCENGWDMQMLNY